MLKFKGCPKCKGNIVIDRDHFGWYEQCMQCGYLHDFDVVYEVTGHSNKPLSKLVQAKLSETKIQRDFAAIIAKH